MRIIHTPGHTPGSICPILERSQDESQVLFLGDSVINNIDRLSRPLMWDRRKRRTLDSSLHLLRELEAEVACFGHGPPLTEEVMDRVRGLTNRPYDLPTWRIALKNWRTPPKVAGQHETAGPLGRRQSGVAGRSAQGQPANNQRRQQRSQAEDKQHYAGGSYPVSQEGICHYSGR